MALTKVSGEVITRPLVLTGNASVSGIMTVGTGSTSTTIDGSYEYPTIRPTLDLNFAATKTLDRRITFTRDSIGTYTDELGIVRTAPNNTPRFDHDPTTGESLGLLIEESRTNIQKISTIRESGIDGSRFSVNTASEQTAGENTNGVVGPDGTAKGVCRLFFTGSETDPSGSVYVAAGTNSGTGADYTTTNTHTSSVWIRPGLETEWKITAHSAYASSSAGGSATNLNFIFTLTGEGTVTSIQTGGIAASVKKYPNNWYRCTITYHRNSTTTVSSGWGLLVYPNVYYAYNAQSQTGDIGWVWGPQVEQGSFATSYIPTSGSTVTRAAEIASITGTNFTGFYNGTEGTVFSEIRPMNLGEPTTSGHVYWSFNQVGGFGEGFYFTNSSGVQSTSGYVVLDNSASQVTGVNSPNLSDGVDFKSAFVYKENDYISATNGTLGSADDNATVPTNERLVIGNNAWGSSSPSNTLNAANAHFKSFKYYNKRLPNSQLQGLTAQ